MMMPSMVKVLRGDEPRFAATRGPDQLGGVHAAIRPSRSWTCRSAAAATSRSWVMRTIVRPAALSSRSRAMISRPEWLSRLPGRLVGEDHAAAPSPRPGRRPRAGADRRKAPMGTMSDRDPPRPTRRSAAWARSTRSSAGNALVQERRGDVLDRSRPGQQVVVLEDEADGPSADEGQARRRRARRRRAVEDVRRRSSGGPGSRGCSSSSILPDPDGPTMATNSPSSTSRLTSASAGTSTWPIW